MKCLGCLLILAITLGSTHAKERKHPIILVPGDGGSQVLAKINKPSTVSDICYYQSDWFYLWLDPTQMLPWTIACWADNIRLVYDPVTHTTSNSPGVQTKFPDYGNTTSIEYLDVGRSPYAMYFGKMVDHLLRLGYKRKESIFGAPYDFRKAPNEQQKFFADFKALIEHAYEKNQNSPAILVTHSMGSPMTQYFLVHQSPEWKKKYVRAFVSLSGVFGGTVRAVKVFAIGDNLGNYFVSPLGLRYEQRTNPSLAWLMPSPDVWGEDEVLVQGNNMNITLKNFDTFYSALNHTQGKMLRDDTLPLLKGLPAPHVEVYCWHGGNVSTVDRMVYDEFPRSKPDLHMGDGDGTVNKRSMEVCLKWRQEQQQPVHHQIFNNTDHATMLKGDLPVKSVQNLIVQMNQELAKQDELCGNRVDSQCPTITVT